ncbi:MAG TPA: mechanosensitive ion channel family protein [Planctomycetaceae bacterium]|nr:mechanosensitive ion channel family protein [Planctomycetaceae bacterium]
MFQRLFLLLSQFSSKVPRGHLVMLFCSVLCLANTAKCAEAEQANPDVIPTREELRLQLRPLTDEELKKQADAWQVRVQKKVTEVSQLQLEKKTGSANKEIAGLQEEQDELLNRFRVVLDEWEQKGGDPKKYRAYASAVSGLEFDFYNLQATFMVLKNWVMSPQGGLRWVGRLLMFGSILFASWMFSRALSRICGEALSRVEGASSLLRTFLVNFVRQAILVLGFVVSISALGINTSPILALIGGAAFVIGLALQGTLSNFAQGLLILAYRPFDVGDVIDAGGVSGIVDSMNMLSTTIRTFDNKKMIVPNGKIGGDTITNATASSTRRIDMTFGISYDDDVAKAQSILERIINEHPLVMKDPVPLIKMNELGESAINFIARPWAKTEDYWTVFWEVTAAVKQEFDSANISFPYPQQDVHLYQIKET